ncbi:MAG: ABC transporter permease [Spirochaetes bacterium]|nr:ABC transporter permease [Spirochaetota bacterium]
MNLRNAFITALRALSRNKMRSALTSIGIIIGISSVIIMVGIGNSARIAVKKRIYTAGANAITIYDSQKPLTMRNLEDIKRMFTQIQYITPQIYKSKLLVKYKKREIVSRIYGVNNDFFKLKDWDVIYGRYFSDLDIASGNRVVVIGETVRTEIFGYVNPVGEIIQIDSIPFKVIGSLTELGQAFSGRDFDNLLVIPYTTAQVRIIGEKKFDEIITSTFSTEEVDSTTTSIRDYLRIKHSIPPGKPDDFRMETSKDKLKQADYIANVLRILLAFIASISLIVGGIGIMNIMLVSVSERTREIGIRMAIGAKRKDILTQFLIESITLSSAGGIIGITLGLLIYFLIVFFVNWPFLFSPLWVLISFLFASSVGIFFGYYPAKKASQLKPIDALRFE